MKKQVVILSAGFYLFIYLRTALGCIMTGRFYLPVFFAPQVRVMPSSHHALSQAASWRFQGKWLLFPRAGLRLDAWVLVTNF